MICKNYLHFLLRIGACNALTVEETYYYQVGTPEWACFFAQKSASHQLALKFASGGHS